MTPPTRCIHPGCVSAALHVLRGREGLRHVCARHHLNASAPEDAADDIIAATVPGSNVVDMATAAVGSSMMANEYEDNPPRRGPYRIKRSSYDTGGGFADGSGATGAGRRGGRVYSGGLPPPATAEEDGGDEPVVNAAAAVAVAVAAGTRRTDGVSPHDDGDDDDDDAEPIDFRVKRARTANEEGNHQQQAEKDKEKEEEERSSSSPQVRLPNDKARSKPGSDFLERMAVESPGAGFRMLLQTDAGWTHWNWHTALDRTRTTLPNVGE